MIDVHESIHALASNDETERIYAAEDLGYSNKVEAVGPLLARLALERSRAVQEAVFAALAQIEHDAVVDGAMRLLDSEEPYIRNEAVELLRGRASAAIGYLGGAFDGGNADRRKFIIDIVSKLAHNDAATIYHRAFRDPDLNVVITAVESAGNARLSAFRSDIENLVAPDAHPMLLAACVECLAHIGEESSITRVRAVIGRITEAPAYLRPSYLKLLGEKGGPRDFDEVAAFAAGSELEPPVVHALASFRMRCPTLVLPPSLAIPLFNIALGADSPLTAYEAVRLLGTCANTPELLHLLARCLDHPEKAVRIAAVQSLGESHDPQAGRILNERLERETDEEMLQAWRGTTTP